MRDERTVARIGSKSPRWFLVEQNNSVVTDIVMHWILVSTDRATARAGKWAANEDNQLKGAVPAQGFKDWETIASLVPGRTHKQCHNRWRDTLDPSIDPTTARMGQWTADENKKLRDAVPTHGAKNWERIAALVPGRTHKQCRNRWRDASVCSINPATARAGK
jgi:uncharacterized protein (DUF2237 family)